MKKLSRILSLVAIAIAATIASCTNESVYSDLPSTIQSFVSQYFPFGEVSSYRTIKSGVSVVQIRNGATLTFDSANKWVDVDGNGIPLPDDFLYDQLPSKLYKYVSEMESTDGVYQVSRDDREYTVEFINSRVVYDIATRTISYPDAPKS